VIYCRLESVSFSRSLHKYLLTSFSGDILLHIQVRKKLINDNCALNLHFIKNRSRTSGKFSLLKIFFLRYFLYTLLLDKMLSAYVGQNKFN
jgi:hypothetical protein